MQKQYDTDVNYLQQMVRVHYHRRRLGPLYPDDPYAEVYTHTHTHTHTHKLHSENFGEIYYIYRSMQTIVRSSGILNEISYQVIVKTFELNDKVIKFEKLDKHLIHNGCVQQKKPLSERSLILYYDWF